MDGLGIWYSFIKMIWTITFSNVIESEVEVGSTIGLGWNIAVSDIRHVYGIRSMITIFKGNMFGSSLSDVG